MVIDKAELRRMSQAERRELARLLAEFGESAASEPGPGEVKPGEPAPDRADPFQYDPSLRRERRLALLIAAACCVILAGWIVVLAATLPHHFDAHHWRTVWVNFDVFLLAAFAATAWAIWRERQVLILLLVLIGTMLFCDAWFDVGTSLATSGFWTSLLSALLRRAAAGLPGLRRGVAPAQGHGRRRDPGRPGALPPPHAAGGPRPGRGPATRACRAAGRTRRAGQPNPSVGLTGSRRRIDV